MDLDFKSVKALASSTRLEILNNVLEEEATTTGISDKLDKSKSTVSDHLKVLVDAGLVEKDEEEGRRRVIYSPTDKACAIVKGRERKVKFSVVSTALTSITGLVLLGRTFVPSKPQERLASADSQMMMQDATETASNAAASGLSPAEMAVVVIGFGLLVTSALLLSYTYLMKKIGEVND